METFDRKKHWENIYATRELSELSWFEPKPETSLMLLAKFNLPKDAKIIDIGGGDSLMVDHLLELGYEDITVVDLSATALYKARKRLGSRAGKVKWIVADAANFEAPDQYDFWHDRAAFHFLTELSEIDNYIETAQKSIKPNGILVLGTFSDQGPKKCSGIEITQYTEASMAKRLKPYFEKIQCYTVEHETPSRTIQPFIFCSFKNRVDE